MADNFYVGNNDFRGWLAAGSGSKYYSSLPIGQLMYGGDRDAGSMTNILLGHLGNDGRSGNSMYDRAGQYLYDKWQADKYNYEQNKSMQDMIAALRTPTPRFVNYDITASWDKARQMATQAVSPVYQQKLTDFVNRQKTELQRQQDDTVTRKAALDLALGRLREDTQVQRDRTAANTTTNINDITAARDYAARSEGLNFDAANRALTEDVAASGLAESGLGQQQIQETQMARREDSNEQVRQYENKVEAQNILMNRTFEDLMTKETRGEEDTATQKSKLDLDLERFMEDQSYDLDQQQKILELQKQADIAQKSIGIQGQLVDQWLASLAGQGYTAQEIANAASIYK